MHADAWSGLVCTCVGEAIEEVVEDGVGDLGLQAGED